MAYSRRQFVAKAGAAGLAVLAGGRMAQAQVADNPELLAVDFITIAAQKAIDSGLGYLARRQNDDGSFGAGGYSRNVAVCGLAGMAFMASGSTPGRGPFGMHVNRCVEYILANTQDRGFIEAEGFSSHGPMYGHGFATLFLAEAYGMGWMPIADKLTKAVQQIIDTQNKEGGWRYLPERKDADISVTVCQVMALRAARNAGIFVPPETIDNAVDYVKRSQNPDGGFMYMIEGGPSALQRRHLRRRRDLEGLAVFARASPAVERVRSGGALFLRPLLRRAGDVACGRKLLARVVSSDSRPTGRSPAG
jgi:hypothetical protein